MKFIHKFKTIILISIYYFKIKHPKLNKVKMINIKNYKYSYDNINIMNE